MKTIALAPIGIALAAALGALGVEAAPLAASAHDKQVARGKYLVAVGGCNDCHTPLKMGPKGPEPDMARMLSGHPQGLKVTAPASLGQGWMFVGSMTMTAFAGPWGITYAPNLTPEEGTGLLVPWTEEMFVKAMRTGKHFGTSRPIQPPMPWQSLAQASDADLKAIFAFLKAIPPVKNLVPDYEPPAGEKIVERR